MTIEIILVRHASTAWSGLRYCGIGDPPLTAAGVAEARRFAASLAPTLRPDTRIVASRAALDPRGPAPAAARAEGHTFDELTAIAPDVAAALGAGALEIDWPGGETNASLAARVAAAWSDLLADGRPAVVVTHAGPLMHACALAEGRAVAHEDLIAPATARRIEIAAGSTAPTVLRSSA